MERPLPVIRVVVLGNARALAELESRVRGPSVHRHAPDDFAAAWLSETRGRRVWFVVASPRTPRLAVARLDPDVVLLATARQPPFSSCGPPEGFGRTAVPRAVPLLWLGEGARSAIEERTLRGALRAFGLPGDATAVVADDAAALAGLGDALDRVPAGHPDTLHLDPCDAGGTWFCCAACGARLTRGMDRVSTFDLPRPTERFEYNLRLLPGGGVFALAPDAGAWGTRQGLPGPGPREVALLDWVDLVDRVTPVEPQGGGCCGRVPVGEPNLACACGARVGYGWSECVFPAVVALRLDRVVRRSLGRTLLRPARASARG